MRDPLDFYPTPAWVTALAPVPAHVRSVCDPCAGVGSLLATLQRRLGVMVGGLEIDFDRAAAASSTLGVEIQPADALGSPWPESDAVVMNPPFSSAACFVRKAFKHNKLVIALLPLNWLEPTKDRRDLVRLRPDVAVLPRRPRFLGGDRQTAKTSCAWFTWPGRGRLSYLDLGLFDGEVE